MVRAVSKYNIQKINQMSKTFMKKAFATAIFLSALFLTAGILITVFALKQVEINWVSVVMGGIVTLGSCYPIISTLRAQTKNHRDTVKAMQLDKGELVIDITFREKRMEITTSQCGETTEETVLLRNVSKVRLNAKGVAIYIGSDMYYIFNEEIVQGTREELVRIFTKLNVKVGK